MLTTIVEQLADWQAKGGPPLWERAWDRAIGAVEDAFPARDTTNEGMLIAEGAAGLATALYLRAAEENFDSDDVAWGQLDELFGPGLRAQERTAHWEERLTAVGHDLADSSDPVVSVWKVISLFHRPLDGRADAYGTSFARWGPGYIAGAEMLHHLIGLPLVDPGDG
ncbi:hypothetical protein AB0I84_32845 [Streptomyces spectabilis]|uniref:hypothetical protein n=1 Tax=Streptomyces spectabilis TaxID=68270 RepID=UPI00340C46BF